MKTFKIKLRIKFVFLLIVSIEMGCRSGNPDTPSLSSDDHWTLLSISAKDLDGLDQNQWSDVKEIDGKKVRSVVSDEAIFTLPAWWGNSTRPNKGEIFVLEIDYKDVVIHPFIVSSFGNCENSIKYNWLDPENPDIKQNGLRELHRIPGENNATNLWFASVRPAMSNVAGKMVLDFTLIDEWMKEAKKSGLKNIVYFLGGNPYGFPGTMNLERELFTLMQNSGTLAERTNVFLKQAADTSNRGRILEEIRDYYSQWIREVSEYALENDWPLKPRAERIGSMIFGTRQLI